MPILHVSCMAMQAEKVLMYEQQRSEFQPPEGELGAEDLDRPTGACRLVTALFGELGEVGVRCSAPNSRVDACIWTDEL